MVDYNAQIQEFEAEIKKTQYNKATQHHIGLIKAKIAKLRDKAVARSKASAGPKEGYQVRKTGDGTVILLGFPSTGKSTLMNALCGTESETASYAFTTVSVIPGTLKYKHARIQILDVPGIVSGASTGRGRGKEVLACIRNSDICLIISDCLKPKDIETVKKEAFNVGIRLNQRSPDVRISKNSSGGIRVLTTCKLTKIDKRTVRDILREFKINNCDIIIRENIDVDQLIDIIEGNRKYMPAITVFNKSDLVTAKRRKYLEKKWQPDMLVSGQEGTNVEKLRELIYLKLNLMNIYLKEPGKDADLKIPLVMFKNCSIKSVCEKLHKDFTSKFKFSRVWGPSARFDGQKLTLKHRLKDGDILEIHLK
ncbi:GTP-binding protein [Candidatus Woesearchaeota archaeon]|nr:GTP-binding protein [Candidatus Woesearchaeota archaeon]